MPIDRLTRSQAYKQLALFVDWLHSVKDQFEHGGSVSLPYSDDEFQIHLSVSRLMYPSPSVLRLPGDDRAVAREFIPNPTRAPKNTEEMPVDLPPLQAAHTRVLNHVPIGFDHRVKSGTILKACNFPKANSYNRGLITLLVAHGKVLRHEPDKKLYRLE